MAQARRRPPAAGGRRPSPGGRRSPSGRRAPPPEEEYYEEEEYVPDGPPVWERVILSRTFRLVVGATVIAAALAVIVFLIGPANISRAAGMGTNFVTRQSGRVTEVVAVAIANGINTEGRRLWVETATPLPTATATSTPEPTFTPFPTPPPPRRIIEQPTQVPSKPIAPGQPALKAPQPPPLPLDDALASQREYLQIVSDGDVRRALQYWTPEAAPEARSALDATVARGDKYVVKNIAQRPLPQINGVEQTVDIEVNDSSGKTTNVQQRYHWRFFENQWFITARLQ